MIRELECLLSFLSRVQKFKRRFEIRDADACSLLLDDRHMPYLCLDVLPVIEPTYNCV